MTKEMQSDNTELKAEASKKIAANNANLSTPAQQLRTVMQTLTNRQNKTNQSKRVVTEPYYTGVVAVLEGIKQIKPQ